MNRLAGIIYFGVLLALFSGLSSISFGQNVTGSTVGTVTDASGGGVAGAKVSIFSVEHQRVEQTVKTGSTGEYVATLLPVGTYNLAVEASGFKKSQREGIILNANDKLTVNVKLEVGDVTQTVTVEVAPIQVQL